MFRTRGGDDPENLRRAQLRIFGRHAIVEADDVFAGGEEKADDGDKSGVRNHEPPRLFSFRTTSFSPDQMSSTAQTLMSTRPIGNATSLIVSSVMSVGTLDDFFGQDTQIDPSCLSLLRVSRSAAVRCALLLVKMITRSLTPTLFPYTTLLRGNRGGLAKEEFDPAE